MIVHLCMTLLFGISFADPIIQLPNGLIQGRETKTLQQNKTYYAFEKIPYATPPTGQLRFKAPLPAQNWDGILNTTYIDVMCYQENPSEVQESEDCLFVNVFTPKLPTTVDADLLPVMLFIHGGGFGRGWSDFISDGIIQNDVVLVTITYRLGIFGFLSTLDEIIPGNNGLKDQLLAITWTHDNINLFGGDPEKITIFGESAGSTSVSYQLLRQQSQGLFRGAIMESGTALIPSAYQRNAREHAFGTAVLLNQTFSTINDSKSLLDFFLTVDAETLRSTATEYKNTNYGPETEELNQGMFWGPVVEVENPDAFITKKMYGLVQAGNVVSVPIIVGVNSEEALGLYTRDEEYLKTYLGAYDDHLSWLVPADMLVVDETNRTEIGGEIRKIYTGGEPLLQHLGDGIRFFSDTGFTRASIKFGEIYSKVNNTYFYQFSYDGELGGNDIHYDGAEYVAHGEDIPYIFCRLHLDPAGCDISSYPETDQIVSQRMIKMWTNFAKYQNPTPEPTKLLENITWPPVDTDFHYLDINENLNIKDHPKQATYSKWEELYKSLGYDDFDTY